ncbi:MAG: peptide ABC transporter substrate-binding protein [Chloroflexota bacterium]
MKNKSLPLFFNIIFILVTLAACAAPAPAKNLPPTSPTAAATRAPTLSKTKTVIGAWIQEPDAITPYYTSMNYAWWIAQLTLIGLAEWDDKGNLVPELAEVIPSSENSGISPDGLTITWKLKKGLKWSDGQPLTSKDVKFTWESILDSKNKPVSVEGYNKIEKIDTPDDLAVVIKFKEVYPAWYLLFTQGAHNAGAILPEHVFKSKTGLEAHPEIRQPKVVSGPFMISEWKVNTSITLSPNPNFYKGKPRLERIQIRFMPTPEAALAALGSGDVDWYPDFTEADVTLLQKLEPKIHSKVLPTPDYEHYFFNLGSTKSGSDYDGPCPLQDVKVRKAILLGINRVAIVERIYGGKAAVPITQWANSSWTNTDLKFEGYDPAGASRLLDEAGYKVGGDGIRSGMCGGKESKLSFNFETVTTPLRQEIARVVQSDLKKIGVEFKPKFITYGDFFGTYTEGANIATGKFDLAGYTSGHYPDPYTDVWRCSSVINKANPLGTNHTHYCNPSLDALFNTAQAQADPAARKRTFDVIQKYIYDNALVVPLYTHSSVVAYSDRFTPAPFSFLSGMNWNAEMWDAK